MSRKIQIEPTWGLEQDREEVWRALARELGAEHLPGDFWQPERIVAKIGGRAVSLDLFHMYGPDGLHMSCTRLRTPPFQSRSGFRFILAARSVFQDADTLILRASDEKPLRERPQLTSVATGWEQVDTLFFLRTNNAVRAGWLFDERYGRPVMEYLRDEPFCGMELAPDALTGGVQTGQFRLTLTVAEAVADRNRLLRLFELMGETLECFFRPEPE